MTISLFFFKWWPWCCPDDDQKQNDTGPQLANTLHSSYCPHDIVSRSIIFATKKLWLLISTKPHSQRDHSRPSLPGNSELSMPKFLLHAGPLWPAKVPWFTLFVALRATLLPRSPVIRGKLPERGKLRCPLPAFKGSCAYSDYS